MPHATLLPALEIDRRCLLMSLAAASVAGSVSGLALHRAGDGTWILRRDDA